MGTKETTHNGVQFNMESVTTFWCRFWGNWHAYRLSQKAKLKFMKWELHIVVDEAYTMWKCVAWWGEYFLSAWHD